MRIAISGTHRAGKTTLIEALAEHLPGYVRVAEPYHELVEDGYEFNHPPALEDFEAQLEWSIERSGDGEKDILFDRCPLDMLAYIERHDDAESFDREEWLPRIREAVDTLDLIVYVPLEAHSTRDDEAGRVAIDRALGDLLEDWGSDVLEVRGDTAARVQAVLARVREG
jgi:predicted ATPase